MPTSHSRRSNLLQPQYWQIEQIPGLSDEDRTKLQDLGITTTLHLLQQGRKPAQQQAIATQLQLHLHHVQKWVALADLARVPSVGCQYCGVLLHTGVSSVAQLAQMPLHKLHQQVLRLQVATLQRRDLCPAASEMSLWIAQARSLPVL